jgi:hypothetical protein
MDEISQQLQHNLVIETYKQVDALTDKMNALITLISLLCALVIGLIILIIAKNNKDEIQ